MSLLEDEGYRCLKCGKISLKIKGCFPMTVDSAINQPEGYGCMCLAPSFEKVSRQVFKDDKSEVNQNDN